MYYAGPAKTPKGGAFRLIRPDNRRPHGFLCGPVSVSWRLAGHDRQGYLTEQVSDACKKHGGFYLGSIGGAAAILAQDNIKNGKSWNTQTGYGSHLEDRSRGFSGFYVVDDKGNDFSTNSAGYKWDGVAPEIE